MANTTTTIKSLAAVSDVPVRVGDIATPAGYFGLLVQDALSSIAQKYFEFYSTKCDTTLEEACAVLGLPIKPVSASTPAKSTTVPMIGWKEGETAGIPNPSTIVPAKAAPRKRTPKVISPHIDRVAGPDTPPIKGWCTTVHTKGKLSGKYCPRAVTADPLKANAEKCASCWRTQQAAEAKKKAVGGVAPGAGDLAPGAFSTALPVANTRPRSMLEPYKGTKDFFLQKDTNIIYKSVKGTHIACKIDTPDGAVAIGEKEIAIIEQLKVPRLREDGAIVWPDGKITLPVSDTKAEKVIQSPPSLLSIAGISTSTKSSTIIPPPKVTEYDEGDAEEEEYYDDDE